MKSENPPPVAAATRTAPVPAGPIPSGDRHNQLVKFAMGRIRHVASFEELTVDLRRWRDDWCETPSSMPESELAGIAGWCWKARLENRLHDGRHSAFRIDRQVLDLLRGKPAQEDALALCVRLVDQHGHITGKTFPLCHGAMKEAALTSLSKARFLAARRTLENVGLLRLVSKHQAGKKMQTFALAMPFASAAPENVRNLT